MGLNAPEAAGDPCQVVHWGCQDAMDNYEVAQGKSWTFLEEREVQRIPILAGTNK